MGTVRLAARPDTCGSRIRVRHTKWPLKRPERMTLPGRSYEVAVIATGTYDVLTQHRGQASTHRHDRPISGTTVVGNEVSPGVEYQDSCARSLGRQRLRTQDPNR